MIEQGFVDGVEALTFDYDGMAGEVEDELARFIKLDGNKVSIGERPAIARFKDDIQSDDSPSIGGTFRG